MTVWLLKKDTKRKFRVKCLDTLGTWEWLMSLLLLLYSILILLIEDRAAGSLWECRNRPPPLFLDFVFPVVKSLERGWAVPRFRQKCDSVVPAAWCTVIQEKRRNCFSHPVTGDVIPVCGILTSCFLLHMDEDRELMQNCFSFNYWKK